MMKKKNVVFSSTRIISEQDFSTRILLEQEKSRRIQALMTIHWQTRVTNFQAHRVILSRSGFVARSICTCKMEGERGGEGFKMHFIRTYQRRGIQLPKLLFLYISESFRKQHYHFYHLTKITSFLNVLEGLAPYGDQTSYS